MSQSEKLEYYHNKGEQDASNDEEYNPPWDEALSHLTMLTDDQIAQNEAYDEGWRNAQDQK
jgi:hypothetical protein